MKPAKRLLLKISGEVFGPLDFKVISSIAQQLGELQNDKKELAVVIGGGNFIRGSELQKEGWVERVTADHMGMLATIINGLALQEVLIKLGKESSVLSAVPVGEIAEPYSRRRCTQYLEKGRIVILSGGTGNPYFTTDTAAALRASEIKADILLKATKVDGVYSSDPCKNKEARRFDSLTYMEFLNGHYQVMDSTAITLCMENRIPILVFNLHRDKGIVSAVNGEKIGTIIKDF